MKKSVSIIGGGAAGLTLAAWLDPALFEVTIYEKNKALGRKFLVAGKGGFNLTHGEALEDFIQQYTPVEFLKLALTNFTNVDLRIWLESIGIPTFEGSSHRIYPLKSIKPIEVLNKLIALVSTRGTQFVYQDVWKGWNDNNELVFESGKTVKSDIVVFALGGGSWKVTGSDGKWINVFKKKGISTSDLRPSNCAYQVNWSLDFIEKNAGKPLKNISLKCLNKTKKGELVVTNFGLEGNAIYALSPEIQCELDRTGIAEVYIDFKPQFTLAFVKEKIQKSSLKTTEILSKVFRLSRVQIDLIKSTLTKEEYNNNLILANSIKHLKLTILRPATLDEAISTTGGIDLKQLEDNYQLRLLKNHYCIGEMLDWNAPTGGYLLQACFSMAVFLATDLNQKFKS